MKEQKTAVIAITERLAEDLGTKWSWPQQAKSVILPNINAASRTNKIGNFLSQFICHPFRSMAGKSQNSKINLLHNRTLNAEIRNAAAILVDSGWGQEASEVINAMPFLRWIHVVKTGVDHIPLDLLRKRRIMLTCIKGVHAQAVAEFAMGLIYCRLKRLIEHEYLTRQNQWKTIWSQGLAGKTLLILGTGEIGQKLAQLACGNGFVVTGVNSDGRQVDGFIKVQSPGTMATLWAEADVVVNCLPSTTETQEIVGAREFSQLKKGAIFINVGRDETVDSEALLSGLDAGKPEWAALDIAPPPRTHPYRNHSQVLLTHYCAYTSEYAKTHQAKATIDNINAFLAGEKLSGLVDLELGY
jgi:phosphoglycerate dehydrogenase-like enzyme